MGVSCVIDAPGRGKVPHPDYSRRVGEARKALWRAGANRSRTMANIPKGSIPCATHHFPSADHAAHRARPGTLPFATSPPLMENINIINKLKSPFLLVQRAILTFLPLARVGFQDLRYSAEKREFPTPLVIVLSINEHCCKCTPMMELAANLPFSASGIPSPARTLPTGGFLPVLPCSVGFQPRVPDLASSLRGRFQSSVGFQPRVPDLTSSLRGRFQSSVGFQPACPISK